MSNEYDKVFVCNYFYILVQHSKAFELKIKLNYFEKIFIIFKYFAYIKAWPLIEIFMITYNIKKQIFHKVQTR